MGGDGCRCMGACVRRTFAENSPPVVGVTPTGGGRNRLLARAGVFGDSPAGRTSTSATRSPPSPSPAPSAPPHNRLDAAAVTVGGGDTIRQHHSLGSVSPRRRSAVNVTPHTLSRTINKISYHNIQLFMTSF